MMTTPAKSWQMDWHWFALLALTVLINMPMLSPELLFSNDTLHAFIFFHFAYTDLILYDEVPRWIPYLGFGATFDFNLWNTIQPSDYFVMAVGWLCGVRDTLLLYKWSLILSQCFLVLGLYLLSRRFFTSMLTVWMVCLGGLMTTTWMFCAPWCLTSFYLTPLVLWCLLRFHGMQETRVSLAGRARRRLVAAGNGAVHRSLAPADRRGVPGPISVPAAGPCS